MTPQIDPLLFSYAVTDIVEELRWEKKFKSQRDLALAADMTHTYFYKRMDKIFPFDVEDLAKVSRVFGVTPDVIIDRAIQRVLSVDPATLKRVAKRSPERAGASEFEGE